MTQPPTPGPGPGEEPARDPALPGGEGASGRDPRLAAFAEGGPGDSCPPGPGLAATIAELSGPQWRCAEATDDELIGLLGRWDALASWAEAGKLGVVRELLRRRAHVGVGGPAVHGDLPDRWEEGTEHEVSAALAISLRSADNLTCLAWDLQARLPGIGAALAAGTLSPLKARIISDELKVLDDEHAAHAEKLILDRLDGQTPAQLGRLAAQVVCTVDPDGAVKRRECAEREQARVRFWRENGGACALAAFGLPTDAALAANDAINTRAAAYKAAKLRPESRMDQLRVLAFLDILNGITLESRIAHDRAAQAAQAAANGDDGNADAGGGGHDTRRGDNCTSDDAGAGSMSDTDGDGSTSDGNDHGSGNAGDGSTTGPAPVPVLPALTARANLTLPLADLLGLAERPGFAHGLGPLDPALVRDLAATAANSPHSQLCVTITDGEGVAVAHGCARPARTRKNRPASRDGPARWAFTPTGDPGPPGGYGSWTLTLPGGRDLTVTLEPIPVTGCDHRHESPGYQPNDTLRHLVQVRDGTCTFPTCSRHARESDFEHAVPYDKGGRTCACNGSARSRRCHRVKQSKGWTVTQPQPGRHRWTTPSGRTYTQGPMQYPALSSRRELLRSPSVRGGSMPHAERTITIARPQADVYAFFADAENDTRWRPGVTQIHREGPLAVGTRYTQRIAGPGGRQVPADVEITALDPDTRVAFRGVAGPVRPTGGYTFAPAEDGTAVTFTLDAELTGVKKLLMAKPVQKSMDAEMANLDKAKALLESGG